MKLLAPSVLVALFVLGPVAPAHGAPKPGPHPFCGTHEASLPVAKARHDFFQRQLASKRQAGEIPLKSSPDVYQQGQIAILDDDGTATAVPRPFDLAGNAIQYLRRPRGMSAVRSPLGLKELIGDKVELGDDDVVEVDFPEGFRFPFGDEVYDSVFINSNGNLTFGFPEASPFTDLYTLVFGPPRIAALYTDLDPSAATGENGVYVNFLSGRVRVTWLRVPEFNNANENTVQVTLFGNGKVNVAFGNVDALAPIVGVAPFLTTDLFLLDYDQELPVTPRRTAIAERFTQFPEVDGFEAVRLFTENFADVYDSVFIWLDFPALTAGFAFEITLQNEIQGIGQDVFDFSFLFPASPNLESLVQMGDLSRFPDDPDELFMGTASTMVILAHEFGHRWLAFPRFLDENGQPSFDLLNFDGGAHWRYHTHSQGSVMHGNAWTDNGDGTFTSTAEAHTRYSPMDRYLMGLASAASVPDVFYIANPSDGPRAGLPVVGETISGERVDVSLDQVVAAGRAAAAVAGQFAEFVPHGLPPGGP